MRHEIEWGDRSGPRPGASEQQVGAMRSGIAGIEDIGRVGANAIWGKADRSST
jgi:hypothetical protein